MKSLIYVLFLCAILISSSSAQFDWNAKPQNLKVLPDTISGQSLRNTMVGFAQALGVRCSFCHDDSKGKEFSDIDFASDKKPEKDVAREMMKMTHKINKDFISNLKQYRNPALEVSCVTCHHGYEEPIALSSLLMETYKEDGLEASMDKYNNLKQQYYGGFAFDFKEGSLDKYGKNLLELNKDDDALAVFQKNAELFPDWAGAYESLGEVYMSLNNKEEAIKNYKKAFEMNPRNEHAKEMLKKLEGE